MNVSGKSEEPGQFRPHTAGETGPGRGKTVTSACERCRRRKIRCDGETPCATCRRFRISCVRIPRNDTLALEQRVRQLEAQLAEFTTGISSTHSQDSTAAPLPQPWTPEFSTNPDFGSHGSAVAMEQAFSDFQPGNAPSPLGIPSIQVVHYTDSLSPVSLVSPVSPVSPAPSVCVSPSTLLHPPAPAPPNPILDSRDNGLHPSPGAAISPPMTASPSPTHNHMPFLSPRSLPGPPRSRSSSISSLGLDADWGSSPGDLSLYGLTETDLDPSIFEPFPAFPAVEVPWTPTMFEAETLLDKFFDRTEGARYRLARYPLDRSKLFGFLEIVHHSPVPPGNRERTCPVSMARFHVYLAMAIGLAMERKSRSTSIYMLHNCYRLALAETSAPTFWKQMFALEGSILLMIFAQVNSDGSH